jgi:alpha-mannosidase
VELERFAAEVLGPAVYPQRQSLTVAANHLHGEPVAPADALRGEFVPFAVGERWGAIWDTTWFRFEGRVPPAWAGHEVAALVHLGGRRTVGFSAEGLIWVDGRPVQGLHHRHRQFLIGRVGGGEPIEFYVEAAANPIPAWHRADWPLLLPDYDGPPLYQLEQAELVTIDREVEGLRLDLQVLLEVAGQFPERATAVLDAIRDVVALLETTGVAASASAARARLAPLLAPTRASPHRVTAVGHAHIDTAWLWPLREAARKCARTFANQLRLLDRYPEHRFACSQAVHYQWIKEGHPALYDEIRAQVAGGRWEPVGGMWVEADTNVPSGESLVRQLVAGKRFFADEFDIESHELWLPDVFGYSAALPQIAAQAGVTTLVTQKMSWNDTNVFPHSTFWWEGHDGSRVLAHFPPANTYNGEFTVAELVRSQRDYKDHGRSDRSLYPFGYGNGGGGPTAEMLERARRLASLEGLPTVEIDTVGNFVPRVAADGDSLATWVGELYLETHRATLTTHADVKRANRRSEEALRAAEMWSVAAGLDRRQPLEAAWKLLLVQQFHDILPGSSISWVYQDAGRDFAEVQRVAGAVAAEAQTILAGKPGGPGPGPGGSASWVAFNASSHDRREVVELPDGRLGVVAVPACGWASVGHERERDGEGEQVTVGDPVQVGDGWIDNGHLRVAWDGDGLLTSVWDRDAGREVLAPGRRGNLFQLHEDHPKAFDAWNVDRESFDRATDIEEVDTIEIVECHPLRGGVRFVRAFGDSRVTQVMRLAAGSQRLEFRTQVDWHERHRFLKVAFPVDVRSTRATYEIQHGHIERPTVVNTSWDEARFEVCGHRWADLGESGYGVALLNDSKYGYDIRGHVMRLSLLRAPGYPDPEADQGEHRFAYALLPHSGPCYERVVAEAELFNLPLAMVAGSGPGGTGTCGQVIAVDRPGVSVEAVKWADRSDGVVVRLCEVWGWRAPARVTLSIPFTAVTRTDLLERDLARVAHHGNDVTIPLRPFELVTLRFA